MGATLVPEGFPWRTLCYFPELAAMTAGAGATSPVTLSACVFFWHGGQASSAKEQWPCGRMGVFVGRGSGDLVSHEQAKELTLELARGPQNRFPDRPKISEYWKAELYACLDGSPAVRLWVGGGGGARAGKKIKSILLVSSEKCPIVLF